MTIPVWFGGPPDSTPPNGGDAPGRAPRPRVRTTITEDPDTSLAAADALLLTRLRANDEHALETIVHTHATTLTRFAYNVVHSPDLAADLVDDLFVWLWEHRATLEIHGTIRGYLFSAIRHRALNARRDTPSRIAWTDRHAGDPTAAGLSGTTPDPAADLEVQELGTLLRAAIDRLPERRRTAVLLRWIQEMTYAEIAEVMGTSVIAVKQQLNRALHDLRAALPAYLK